MKILTDDDLNFTGTQESQFISKPSEFTQEVIDRFDGNLKYAGDRLPWSKTHNFVALRPGEVSVWAGYNAHGKSQILGQVAAWTLNKKWLIASMEMKPSATIQRMLRQVAGTKQPANEYINKFLNWTDDRLWIYDQQDSVSSDRILGMIHYAARELKVEHIVIDSLMKCGIATDDYSKQKYFVDKLCWAAKNYNIHVHLVHHIRKGIDEMKMPGKMDLKGSGDISDLVDNVFIVHRNKAKEKKIQKGDEVSETEPDCRLGVEKQRHGEWEGIFNFWFHNDSMQYVPDYRNMVMPFNLIK